MLLSSQRWRSAVPLIIGIATGLVFSYGFGRFFDWLYPLIGAPRDPSIAFSVAINAPAFVFGAVGGILVPTRADQSRVNDTLVCCIAAAAVLLIASFIYGGVLTVTAQLRNTGLWIFLAGIFAASLSRGVRRRAP